MIEAPACTTSSLCLASYPASICTVVAPQHLDRDGVLSRDAAASPAGIWARLLFAIRVLYDLLVWSKFQSREIWFSHQVFTLLSSLVSTLAKAKTLLQRAISIWCICKKSGWYRLVLSNSLIIKLMQMSIGRSVFVGKRIFLCFYSVYCIFQVLWLLLWAHGGRCWVSISSISKYASDQIQQKQGWQERPS